MKFKICLFIFVCTFTHSFAGISDYSQLIKVLTTDAKPPERTNNTREYVGKLLMKKSVILNFFGIIQKFKGYKAEEYEVITEDGYILTLHRIYSSSNISTRTDKPVVYLLNGLGETSELYVLFGPKQALTFQLANAGYDVWIGNVRGTTYSKKHTTFNSTDNTYWNFSLDEIATYDVSSCIDFILKETQQRKLTLIAYSMGSTIGYMLLSEKPEYNEKVNLFINMAPITYFLAPTDKFLSAVLTSILWIHSMSMKITKTKLTYEVLPQSAILEQFGRYSCTGTKYSGCKQFIKLVADVNSIDPHMLPKIFGYLPAGMSYNTLRHYQQILKSKGRFQKYDYRCSRFDFTCPTATTTNLAKYKQTIPPEYNLSKVTVPNVIFYSAQDKTASPKDVEYLIKKLPNVILSAKTPGYKKFNHLDFLWNRDARSVVYNLILQAMEKHI